MRTPGLEDNLQAGADQVAEIDPGAAALNPQVQKAKLRPHPSLYLVSEGDTVVDGLEINQDPLPLIGTHADRHLG
jgi:hypothetical protein